MVRVAVPQYTLRGQPVQLECQFDLQGDKLYSVSWYKDHDEFYRYLPRGNPSQHTYRVDGIKVDHVNSDEQKVVIRNVPLKAAGMYRCEVSAEAPAFSSVHGESRMTVVALPKEGPEISGEERNYQIGDEISLNCSSARSFPPARLKWFVNDELVGAEYEVMIQQHGLMMSVAGLRLVLEPQHFRGGRLQVRCVATISTSDAPASAPSVPAAPVAVLHAPEHHRLSASSPPPQLDYNREALFSVTGSACVAKTSIFLLSLAALTSLMS